MHTTRTTIIAWVILGIATVSNAGIIQNSDFESGTLDPWVSVLADGSAPDPEMNWTITNETSHSGEYCAIAIAAQSVYLRYDVGQLHASEIEEFSCWAKEDHADIYHYDFFMELYYVHADMPSVGQTFLKTFNLVSSDWEHVDAFEWLQETGDSADGSWGEGKALLKSIGFTGDPHEQRYVHIDDVTLSLTPEPGSLALLAIAFAGLLRRCRR